FIDAGDWPSAYARLDAAPEPWEPWHSVAVLRQSGLLLNSAYYKLWRALALPVAGAQALGSLRLDGGSLDEVCMPPASPGRRVVPDLEALKDAMAVLLEQSAPDSAGGGSNNWAVHGSRTASGKPLLAG